MITKLVLLSFLITSLAANAGDLNVAIEVGSAKSDPVLVALFDSANAFPEGKPVASVEVPLVQGLAKITFKDVSPGRYAIVGFVDLNGNMKMDVGEPRGIVQYGSTKMDSNTFSDASFEVVGQTLEMKMKLK